MTKKEEEKQQQKLKNKKRKQIRNKEEKKSIARMTTVQRLFIYPISLRIEFWGIAF